MSGRKGGQSVCWSAVTLGLLALSAAPALAQPPRADYATIADDGEPDGAPGGSPGLFATFADSLFGGDTAEGRWRPLDFRSFFREGWLEPWVIGPAGREGLTPRQGWLNSFDGVFFPFSAVNYFQ